eukprot:5813401-Prymnesium_polylepis.1
MAPPTHANASPPPGPNVSLLDTRLTLAALFARCAANPPPPLHPSSWMHRHGWMANHCLRLSTCSGWCGRC